MPEGAGKADRPVRLSDSGSFPAHTRPPAPAAPGPPLLQKGAAGPAPRDRRGARAACLFPAGVKRGRRAPALRPFACPVSRGPRRSLSPESPVLMCGYKGSCFCPFRRELGGEFVIFLFFLQEHFFSVTMKFGKSAPGAMPRGFPQYTRNERLV